MEEYLDLFNGLDISLLGSKLVIEDTEYTKSSLRKGLFDIVDDTTEKGTALLRMEKKDPDKFKTLVNTMFDFFKKELRPKVVTGLEGVEGLDNLTPVVSMEDGEVYLINEAYDTVSNVTYKAWLKTLDASFRKVIETSPMLIARFIFDPYDTTKIRRGGIDNDTLNMVFINRYNSAPWMSSDDTTSGTFLEEFLVHLFAGNREQINYCKSWMAETIWGRNETYLVLNGDKGVGKNTLYEIMRALIGSQYCVTAPKSLVTSSFNSALMDRRLVLLDEFKIGRTEHRYLKKIINKVQTIEKKGVDANKDSETFNSFMIFHNEVRDMYIEKDDRRFSVLDITKDSLLVKWTGEEIQEYLIQLNDPKSGLVSAIGNELKEWREITEFSNTDVLKGEKFHEIVEYHLPAWLRISVAMIENGEVKDGIISFKKDIEKRLSSESMGSKNRVQWRATTLEKVLKEYKYKGSWSFGTIEKSDRGLCIEVNADLLDHFAYDVEEDDGDIL